MQRDPYWMMADVSKLTLISSDIVDGGTLGSAQVSARIGGGDVSPELVWSDYTEDKTKSFAVTVYDPDAPTPSGFWHWALYNIPSNVTELPAGAGGGMDKIPPGTLALKNDRGVYEYVGAAPPVGTGEHRYVFAVYALDVEKLDLHEHATPAFLSFNILQHVVAWGRITATYEQKI